MAALEAELCAFFAERCEADAALLTSHRAAALALTCAAAVAEGGDGGIVLQRGHYIAIGDTSVGDLVELADGYLIEIGAVDRCCLEEVSAALDTADGGIFVARTSPGLVDLPNFLYACHVAGKPSIVEADADEYWVPFIDANAQMVVGAAGQLVQGTELGLIVGSASWIEICRDLRTGLAELCRPSAAELERLERLRGKGSG